MHVCVYVSMRLCVSVCVCLYVCVSVLSMRCVQCYVDWSGISSGYDVYIMHCHVYPMCIYADMMCRWYVCYVYLMFFSIVITSCHVIVWVSPQDATLTGLQRIMRRRGGSQSDTTP